MFSEVAVNSARCSHEDGDGDGVSLDSGQGTSYLVFDQSLGQERHRRRRRISPAKTLICLIKEQSCAADCGNCGEMVKHGDALVIIRSW
jgi:hypothetical protein